MRLEMCSYVTTDKHMHVYMYICIYACVYVYISFVITYMYIQMQIPTYIYIYRYVCTGHASEWLSCNASIAVTSMLCSPSSAVFWRLRPALGMPLV